MRSLRRWLVLGRRRRLALSCLVATMVILTVMRIGGTVNLPSHDPADFELDQGPQNGEHAHKEEPSSALTTTGTPAKMQDEVKCEDSEFMFNGKCSPCHRQCLQGCLAGGDDSCFACRSAKDGNRCVEKCPRSRPYLGGASGRWCVSHCPDGQAPDVAQRCKPKWEAKRSFLSRTKTQHEATTAHPLTTEVKSYIKGTCGFCMHNCQLHFYFLDKFRKKDIIKLTHRFSLPWCRLFSNHVFEVSFRTCIRRTHSRKIVLHRVYTEC